jgi:hypothetical protein
MEYNLVELWLRKDPIRWISGALAGLFAGLVAMGLAMFIASASGMDPWFPVKLIGSTALGPEATQIGFNLRSILVGGFLFEAVCLFLGGVYAHFTGTNYLGALLPMGLVWAAFSWIFIWNLFMQSFNTVFTAQISSGVVFPICIAYGLSLASVAFFDQKLRGN